jgi:caffeoyl-CoA O-methyltransferase
MSDDDSRDGKRYTTPAITDYVDRTHAPQDAALTRAFAIPDGIPAIQLAKSEGRMLTLLLQLVGARKIVEVGTLVGYSAIVMARALPAGGRLWTIEYEPRHAEVAAANIAAAGLADKVTVLVGAGRDVLPTLDPEAPFDAVFLDADKEGYEWYATWAMQHLRRGGLILGDNAYLFGELMDDTPRGRSMRGFHELVARTCDSVCVPTPDGLVVGIKR